MTLLEAHRCDLCGELFYVPEEPLRKLELTESNKTTFDYDLCFDCKEALYTWILARRTKQ